MLFAMTFTREKKAFVVSAVLNGKPKKRLKNIKITLNRQKQECQFSGLEKFLLKWMSQIVFNLNKKPIDNRIKVCYTIITKEKKGNKKNGRTY